MSAGVSRGSKLSARREYAAGRLTLRSADRHDLTNGEQTPAQRVKTKASSSGRQRDNSDSMICAPMDVVSRMSGTDV